MKLKNLILMTMLSAPAVSFAGPWGALAYDKYDGRIGYSWNHNSAAAARISARSYCRTRYRGRRCRILTTFRNSCVSLALGRGAYGWATNPSRERAKIEARVQCAKYGGTGCYTKIVKCSFGPYR